MSNHRGFLFFRRHPTAVIASVSEATQSCACGFWIAASLTLLAMTGERFRMTLLACHIGFASSQGRRDGHPSSSYLPATAISG